MRWLPLLLIGPLLLAHSDHRSTRSPKSRHAGPVSTAKEAKDIAQKDTGGIAISARRIPLNGATGGWEVDVHMPNEDRGWRCIVDCDTHTVYTKDRIPNPPLKKQKKH